MLENEIKEMSIDLAKLTQSFLLLLYCLIASPHSVAFQVLHLSITLYLETATLNLCILGHFIDTTFALGWLNLTNLGTVQAALDQDCKLFNLIQRVAACLRVFKLTSDVGISISIERFLAACVLAKHFHIYL